METKIVGKPSSKKVPSVRQILLNYFYNSTLTSNSQEFVTETSASHSVAAVSTIGAQKKVNILNFMTKVSLYN